MRYGFTKNDPRQLLNRGAFKVFTNENDLVGIFNSRDDELITDDPDNYLVAGMVDEAGWRVLKIDDVPLGMTFDNENTIQYLKDVGYSASEIAKAIDIPERTIAKSNAFDSERISKAYLKPENGNFESMDPYQRADASIADLKKAIVDGASFVRAYRHGL